jgi:hypothetical protein
MSDFMIAAELGLTRQWLMNCNTDANGEGLQNLQWPSAKEREI